MYGWGVHSSISYIQKIGKHFNPNPDQQISKHEMGILKNKLLHLSNRPTFASQITNSYMDHISLKEGYLRENTFEKTPLYVSLRCYLGFDACGFAVKSRPVAYKPFKLIFRKAPDMSNATTADGNSALRIICAIALSSIYKGVCTMILLLL